MPNKKYCWICLQCGHEWWATIWNRTHGQGCPACVGQAVTPKNCLATKFPKLAAEWHPTKNGDLTPDDVTCGTRRKVWWKCKKHGHEWEGSINHRVNGIGCPVCSGRVATPETCLAIKNPKLCKEWHPAKNEDLTPYDVKPGSHNKVWWVCSECKWIWQASIVNRSIHSRGCPACAGQSVSQKNCLAAKYPKLAKEWHPIKNCDLTPNDVTPGSNKKVWWICPKTKCGHEWEASLHNRSKGRGCPACRGLATTHKNCLAARNPDLAAEWHPTKNGDLTPYEVTPGRGGKVWWLCEKCKYEWKARICSRSTGIGCPACSNQVVTSKNCLADKSPRLIEEWHPTKNGDLVPQSVTIGSNRKVWWRCIKCNWEWHAVIAQRALGRSCPACAGQVATPQNSLAARFPELAKEWHPTRNGDLTPDDVTIGSAKKIWWKCSKCGHMWQSLVKSRVSGQGCPACAGRKGVIKREPQKIWWICKKCGHEWQAAIKNRTRGSGCEICAKRRSNK